MQAARAALNITGQNMTNAQTDGYTRQRVDQSALSPAAMNMLYAAAAGSYTGQGTGITGIEQLRDQFLDSEYRTQYAVSGSTTTQVNALKDIETALDESTSDGVSAAFSNLVKQMEGLTSSGSSTTFTESTLKEAASLFATKLNIASGDIDTVWKQQYNYLSTYGSDKVNTLLKSIAGLSDTISSAQISGQPALELLDERNKDLDELSQYVSIKTVESSTDVGSGKSVETLSVVLADSSGNALTDANGDPYRLVDGNKFSKFTVSSDGFQEDGVTPKLASDPYDFVHIRLSGLTGDGKNFNAISGAIATKADGTLSVTGTSTYDFSGTAVSVTTSTGDTIPALQKEFQTALDAAGLGVKVGVTSDGKQLTFNKTDGTSLSVSLHTGSPKDVLGLGATTSSSTDVSKANSLLQSGELSGYLKLLNQSGEFDASADYRGVGYYRQMLDTVAKNFATVLNKLNSTNDAQDNKPLFTDSSNGTSNINAGNIRIASAWVSGYLTTSKDVANAGDSKAGSNTNITAMLTALTTSKYTLSSPHCSDLFTGTVQESVSNISLTLGQDIDSVQSQDDTNANQLNNIETRRQALSSVDINEEAINLTVYNQALTAAARFTTTVDECLSTIINNMGVAGK